MSMTSMSGIGSSIFKPKPEPIVEDTSEKDARIEKLRQAVLDGHAAESLSQVQGFKIFADTVNARIEQLRCKWESDETADVKILRVQIAELRGVLKILENVQRTGLEAARELDELTRNM